VTQTALLVFARGAGLMFRAPGFTHPAVPMIVRLALALALALGIAPALATHRDLNLTLLTIAVAGEVAIGAAIGIGASLLYDGAYYGGRMIDDYVGFRGSVPNAAVTSAQGFGRLWSALFLAGFFLLDGDAVVIRAFAESFDRVGAGALIGSDAWYAFALALPQTIAKAALLVAAPAITVAAVVQIALAAVTRVVPRFSSFTLSFPIVFAAAVLVAIATLPLYGPLAAHPLMLVPYGAAR
jgi:flagellar biosynthesis protein FliR